MEINGVTKPFGDLTAREKKLADAIQRVGVCPKKYLEKYLNKTNQPDFLMDFYREKRFWWMKSQEI